MPVNHVKEFLKSVHNEALFSGLVFRTLIEVSSLNFKAKFLKMAKINSEFLNVSLVEPAPESATTLVSLTSRHATICILYKFHFFKGQMDQFSKSIYGKLSFGLFSFSMTLFNKTNQYIYHTACNVSFHIN